MNRSNKVLATLGLTMALSLTVIGMTLAAPKTHVATTLVERESLDMKLLAPLEKRTSWHGGAVLPVRVFLKEPDKPLSGANVTISVNDMPGTSIQSVDQGNNFTDLGGGFYQFNLDTRPYQAGPGSEPINIVIIVHSPDDRTASIEKTLSLI